MKRHNFAGMPASHGQTKTHRRMGGYGGGQVSALAEPQSFGTQKRRVLDDHIALVTSHHALSGPRTRVEGQAQRRTHGRSEALAAQPGRPPH